MAATTILCGKIEAVQTVTGINPAADYEPITVISVADNHGRLKVAYGGRALLSRLLDLWPQGLEGHCVQIQLHGHLVASLESLESAR